VLQNIGPDQADGIIDLVGYMKFHETQAAFLMLKRRAWQNKIVFGGLLLIDVSILKARMRE